MDRRRGDGGVIVLIFGGFKSGFATATEISAFAALYALVAGSIVFRELGWRAAVRSFTQSAVRSGLIMFIVAGAQSLAFILTLQQSAGHGSRAGAFVADQRHLAVHDPSIAILIVMGSVLEGAAALIIFGPMLVPVAAQLGSHLCISGGASRGDGDCLFAPPLGLGLYGVCLISNVPIETRSSRF